MSRLSVSNWFRRGRSRRAAGIAVMGAALAVAPLLAPVASAGDASAAPGCRATGGGTYRCQVYSPSMHTRIGVDVRPGGRGAKATYLLDGAKASENVNLLWVAGAKNKFAGQTVVAPLGGAGSWYTDWYSKTPSQSHIFKYETFLNRELPRYLNKNFGTPMSGNNIAGFSMSAGPAVILASRAGSPFRNGHVLAIAGFYHTELFPAAVQAVNFAGGLTSTVFQQWGVPFLDPAWYRNAAHLQTAGLRRNHVTVTLTAARGNDSGGLTDPAAATYFAAVEKVCRLSTDAFLGQLRADGIRTYDGRTNAGNHDMQTWMRALNRDVSAGHFR